MANVVSAARAGSCDQAICLEPPARVGLRQRAHFLNPEYLFTLSSIFANRLLQWCPPAHWWHRRSLRHSLVVTEVEISLSGLGSELDGCCLAFLSDIHAGSFMREHELREVFSRVMSFEPDLLCLGGDLVNSHKSDYAHLAPVLAECQPELGVYAVPGNHEHFFGLHGEIWQNFLAENNIIDLTNCGQRIERGSASFWLCGIDDYDEGQPSIRRATHGRKQQEPTVLLSHNPDTFGAAANNAIDLTLAGHTHGGQIRVLGKPVLEHSEHGLLDGLYEDGTSKLYVSRGVGVSILPLRIGCPAEVVLVRLRAASSQEASSGE